MTTRLSFTVPIEDVRVGDLVTIDKVVREVIAPPEEHLLQGRRHYRLKLKPVRSMPGLFYAPPGKALQVSRPGRA